MKALKKLLRTTLKLVIFAAVAGAGYYGYLQYSAEVEDESLGAIPTVFADVRDITVSVSATGILQPVRIVEIKSKASGEILDMPVEMGDYLVAGDLIAQIDTRILDQELKQVEADFESAQIRLQIAGRQYDRAESLQQQDLISETDLETSKQNFSNAESQFIRAEASLALARERLEDTTVTAPISGTIIAKSVEQGQIIASSTNNVSGGTVLIQMADLSELEIRTLVDEIDIGSVKPGLRVESTVEAFSDMRFEGQVMKIEPQAVVQQSVTTFPVLSRIDNSQGRLLPSMNADVNIIIHERHGVLTVANEAVRSPADASEVIALLNLNTPISAEPTALATVEMSSDDGSESANRHGANGDGANGGIPAHEDPTKAAPADSWGSDGLRREAGVVFVLGDDGAIRPRQVVTGVRDWERSEVLSGLEAGEEIVLLPSTSLLRSQRSARDRFARRATLVPGAAR